MSSSWLLILVSLLPLFTGFNAVPFTLQNRCKQTIWPGIQSIVDQPLISNGGLQLKSNETVIVEAPSGWTGRIWARSGCKFDQSGKQGNCSTGDCGGLLQCNGTEGTPPASVAEFSLDSIGDLYDVNLVYGFNVPISIIPSGGSGYCNAVRCTTNINLQCPEKLKETVDGEVVACKSPCQAFNQPQFCCTGYYSNPITCQPTNYTEVFKKACPAAYTYPYDDGTSIFTCTGGANYSIIFC